MKINQINNYEKQKTKAQEISETNKNFALISALKSIHFKKTVARIFQYKSKQKVPQF
jgi:hypothetical protein